MKTARLLARVAHWAPSVRRWTLPFVFLVCGCGFLLAACGSGSGAPPRLPSGVTVVLSIASKDTSALVSEHHHTFQLVGLDDLVYEPTSIEKVGGKYSATFRVPNAPWPSAFTKVGPRFYKVIAYDSGYLTGVSTIMVSDSPKGDGGTWHFPVDARLDLLLGNYILQLATNLSGGSDKTLYDRLAAFWQISRPPPDAYGHVDENAGEYTSEHPVTSPTQAAQAILSLLSLPSGEMVEPTGLAANPKAPAMDANTTAMGDRSTSTSPTAITTAGNFAAAVVGEVPIIGPFLSAGVESIFSALAGKNVVSQAELTSYINMIETQLALMQAQLDNAAADLRKFANQSDQEATQAAVGNVQSDVNTIQHTYKVSFLPAFQGVDTNDPNAISTALEANPIMRAQLEGVLISAEISTLTDIMSRYVPQIATVKPASSDQYLAVLSNQLNQDMLDLTTAAGPMAGSNPSIFTSINGAFEAYNALYGQSAIAVAEAFDLAEQMLGMAQYLSVNYGNTDNYHPTGIPTWAYDPIDPGSTVAPAFVNANGQEWNFMTTQNLSGSCPSNWTGSSLYGSLPSNYKTSCPWVMLPLSNSVVAPWPWPDAGGGCTLVDWNANSYYFMVNCNGTFSLFGYYGCGMSSLTVWSNYLFCDNTNMGNLNTNAFTTPAAAGTGISSIDKGTMSIDVQLGGGVWIFFDDFGGLSSGSPVYSGPNGGYVTELTLNPANQNFNALIKDQNSDGYLFNLIYTGAENGSPYLACPLGNGVGGWTSLYTGSDATAFDPDNPGDPRYAAGNYTTGLCSPGGPYVSTVCVTAPPSDGESSCSCVTMNNTTWYCLVQGRDEISGEGWLSQAVLQGGQVSQ